MPNARDFLTLLVTIYLPTMVMSFGHSMVAPMLPTLSREFGITDGIAAQLITASSAGRLASLAPSGLAVDRLGTRPTMLVGAAMVAAGSLLAALSPNFAILLAAQAIVGAGNSAWMQGREVAAIDQVSAEKRGRMISSLFGVSTAGMAIGPVISGLLTEQFSFRGSFLLFMAFALLVLAIGAATRQVRRAGHAHGHHGAAAGGPSGLGLVGLVHPYYRVTFVILLLATCGAHLRYTALTTLLPLYGTVERGLSTTEIGALFGLLAVVNLAMIGPMGYLSDRWGRKAAIVPSIALGAVALVLYPFAPGLPALGAVTLLMGVGNGLALGSMTISTYDIAPQQHRGVLQSLRRGVGELGTFIGPVIAGVIIDLFSPSVAFHVFAPIFLVLVYLAAFVARETHPHRRSPQAPSYT